MTNDDDDFIAPPSKIPRPEPATPSAEPHWSKRVPGEPAWPAFSMDGPWKGCWSAGGLVKQTLCIDESGLPRCIHCTPDNKCSGPANEEMRQDMEYCIAFIPRGGVL